MQSVFVHAPADAVRAICRTKLCPMLLLSEREGLISGRCTAPRKAYYLSASQEPVFASVCVNNVELRRRGPQVRPALLKKSDALQLLQAIRQSMHLCGIIGWVM